jgi:hypothetical protein
MKFMFFYIINQFSLEYEYIHIHEHIYSNSWGNTYICIYMHTYVCSISQFYHKINFFKKNVIVLCSIEMSF